MSFTALVVLLVIVVALLATAAAVIYKCPDPEAPVEIRIAEHELETDKEDAPPPYYAVFAAAVATGPSSNV